MQDEQNQALNEITQAVMGLLDSWKLDTREIQGILCLPDTVRARAINKFREGSAVLPDDPVVLRRARYLLRIADALRTTYPLNPRMAGRWVRQEPVRLARLELLRDIPRDCRRAATERSPTWWAGA